MFEEVNKFHDLPGREDLSGAAEAIQRLQDTYQIETSDFADGKLLTEQNEKVPKNSPKLSTEDAYHLAQTAYMNENAYHTAVWARQAWNQYKNGDQTYLDGLPI